MCVTSIFSSLQYLINSSISSLPTTTAIRSWLSDMASSVADSPEYFVRTRSRYMSSPSASSPTATHTPPAPKSFAFFTRRVASLLRNSRCSLRSSGALPFCTSLLHRSRLSVVCSFDEPVAPPTPSRPVRPNISTTSPAFGFSRLTSSTLTAPTTAPTSRRLATYWSWYISRTNVVASPIWLPYDE